MPTLFNSAPASLATNAAISDYAAFILSKLYEALFKITLSMNKLCEVSCVALPRAAKTCGLGGGGWCSIQAYILAADQSFPTRTRVQEREVAGHSSVGL
jgi:hypothetical protein